MNTISTYPYDHPPVEFHQKKLLLNEEFNTQARIQGLVSLIYYPSQQEVSFLGHAELEVEGQSWTLMLYPNAKPLAKMIRSSLSGTGYPFFRFDISVTPNQLQELRKNVMTTKGPFCAIGALKALSRYGDYSVPFPVSLFPLASAAYLTVAKALGSRRIGQIQFYGDQNCPMMNLAKGLPGVIVEACFIFAATNLVFRRACDILNLK